MKKITNSRVNVLEGMEADEIAMMVDFGAYLYRRGLIKGAIVSVLGFTIGAVGAEIASTIREFKESDTL